MENSCYENEQLTKFTVCKIHDTENSQCGKLLCMQKTYDIQIHVVEKQCHRKVVMQKSRDRKYATWQTCIGSTYRKSLTVLYYQLQTSKSLPSPLKFVPLQAAKKKFAYPAVIEFIFQLRLPKKFGFSQFLSIFFTDQ